MNRKEEKKKEIWLGLAKLSLDKCYTFQIFLTKIGS